MAYVALNVHTGYDFLSSAIKTEDLPKICERLNFNTLGICDRGMFGYPLFYKTLSSHSYRPLYGLTIDVSFNDAIIPLVLYIKNEIGYQNLTNLIYDYPSLELPYQDLVKYHEGLLAILPTKGNEIVVENFKTNEQNWQHFVLNLIDLFDDFYLGLEIYTKSDLLFADKIRSFASLNHCEIVFFNLHLYSTKDDAIVLEILNAIKNDQKLTMTTATGPYYFRDEEKLKSIFKPNEMDNTLKIAQLLEFELIRKRGKLLSFPLKSEISKRQYIFDLSINNLKSFYGEVQETYINRLNYELDVIEKMGYLDYFLIVADYCNFAKTHQIPVGPGRGSAAGSLVSFALKITTIDPLKYDLQFERFLNPYRMSMPDIDIDFSDQRRQEVVDYIASFYGEEKMANIVTYQTIGAKQALRDIGRVFSFNQLDINELCSKMRLYNGTLRENYKASLEFRDLLKDQYFLNIVTLASKIEGFPRQRGMHAAGIILNDENLQNVIPVVREDGHHLVSQFDMSILESLGFLKMDLLGLRNLTLLEEIVSRVNAKDPSFKLENIPLDDSKTYELFKRDLVLGIFQLESSGMRLAMKQIIINSFDDLVALLALYRPGPMDSIPLYAERKNNHLPLTYLDTRLEPILKPTYGVIIYQEQISEIVKAIAGFDLGKADIFRRAISKKDAQKMESLRQDFIEGAINNGVDKQIAIQVFDLIDRFANYGFNKSHSVAYAMISYQLQYLKANYPQEFFASYLDQELLDEANYALIKKEFAPFHLHLLLPNINLSTTQYEISADGLIMPFSSIKNLPSNIIEEILLERKKRLYSDFIDFVSRNASGNLKIVHLIALINSGALDGFSLNRATMRHQAPILLEYYQSYGAMLTLLSDEERRMVAPHLDVLEEDLIIKYQQEYECLGILLSGSFLYRYEEKIKKLNILPFNQQLTQYRIKVVGIVLNVRLINTKKNETMAICIMNDDNSTFEVIVFAKLYRTTGQLLKKGMGLIIEGHLKHENDREQLLAETIESLED